MWAAPEATVRIYNASVLENGAPKLLWTGQAPEDANNAAQPPSKPLGPVSPGEKSNVGAPARAIFQRARPRSNFVLTRHKADQIARIEKQLRGYSEADTQFALSLFGPFANVAHPRATSKTEKTLRAAVDAKLGSFIRRHQRAWLPELEAHFRKHAAPSVLAGFLAGAEFRGDPMLNGVRPRAARVHARARRCRASRGHAQKAELGAAEGNDLGAAETGAAASKSADRYRNRAHA